MLEELPAESRRLMVANILEVDNDKDVGRVDDDGCVDRCTYRMIDKDGWKRGNRIDMLSIVLD